jgi:ribonuclease HII
MKSNPKNFPNNEFELELLKQGYDTIVGIDEVGRGCWAGPVYVGAVIYTAQTLVIPEVADSKLVSPKKRELLFPQIAAHTQYHLEVGTVAMINEIGIGNTIVSLIRNVIEKFKYLHVYYLVDGHFAQDFGANTKQIIKGDMKHYSISAASIMAKVERDRQMVELDTVYPGWNFAKHKGYGTADHIQALKINGISPIHRLNYKPIMGFINVSNKT